MKNKYLTQLLAIGTIAAGVSISVPMAPAFAVTFTSGELDFGVFTSPFGTLPNPVAGNNFNVTFNPTNTANILRADGSFSPTFSVGSIGTNSSTANFAFVSGNTYRLTNDLVINFATATPTTFTLRQNSTFTQTDIFNNVGIRTGSGLQLATNVGSFFTNAGDISNIPTLSFSLNDTGLPSGGLYIAQASPTAVPEPFTVVGTIVAGAAALRMRKRLKAENKL